MPLIELLNTTKLRSLGFGHDQPHGGSSPQPYVQTQIPTKKELDRPSPDFLLRGATNADPFLSTGNDLERIGKWFFQEPVKGTLFIAKQNLLSRTAAATDVSDLKLSGGLNGGIYTPASTLLQVGVSAFGLHVNKQGLNPIPSDPGAGFLQSLLSIGSQPLYGTTVYNNSKNGFVFSLNPAFGKLASLANVLGVFPGKKVNTPIFSSNVGLTSVNSYNNFLLQLHSKRILNGTQAPDLYSYSGGPGSILGIGNTGIKFATDAGGNAVRTNIFPQNNYLDPINSGFVKGGALAYTQEEIFTYGVPYQTINDGRVVGNTPYSDFRTQLRSRLFKLNKDLKNIPIRYTTDFSYTDENKLESRTLIGDPGIYNTADPTLGPAVQAKKRDKLNSLPVLTPILDDYDAEQLRQRYDKDLITFKIQVINNDAPNAENDAVLYFRAFLDSITDQYSSDWDSTQYVGRGEKFYNYRGFDRQISLGWTVAAQSQAELIPMYNRLNYLASVCAPDYSSAGFMRGNLVKLTIGGYIYEQIGIIKGFSYEMREEYPWEIGLSPFDDSQPQLSQVIKVNGFQFTPIHSQVPAKGAGVFIHRAVPAKKTNTNKGSYLPTAVDFTSATPEKSLTTEFDSSQLLKYVEKPELLDIPVGPSYLEKYNTALIKSLDDKASAVKSTSVSLKQDSQGCEMNPTTSQVTNPTVTIDKAKWAYDNLREQFKRAQGKNPVPATGLGTQKDIIE